MVETGATVGTVTLKTTHTAAGTYASDSWSFTGTANYNSIASTTITDTIGKANATVVVTSYTVTYNGSPHTATVTSITGVDGGNGCHRGRRHAEHDAHAAGTYTSDSWSFAGTANYNGIASTTITDTINTAAPTVNVSDPGGISTGNPYPATATAVGFDGVTAVSGSFGLTYYQGTGTGGTDLGATAPSGVGTYTVVANFTSADLDYSNGSAQTTFFISQAALATHDGERQRRGREFNTGNPYPATATAVGTDGVTPVSGTFSFAYYTGSTASGTPSATAPSAPTRIPSSPTSPAATPATTKTLPLRSHSPSARPRQR